MLKHSLELWSLAWHITLMPSPPMLVIKVRSFTWNTNLIFWYYHTHKRVSASALRSFKTSLRLSIIHFTLYFWYTSGTFLLEKRRRSCLDFTPLNCSSWCLFFKSRKKFKGVKWRHLGLCFFFPLICLFLNCWSAPLRITQSTMCAHIKQCCTFTIQIKQYFIPWFFNFSPRDTSTVSHCFAIVTWDKPVTETINCHELLYQSKFVICICRIISGTSPGRVAFICIQERYLLGLN